MDILDVRCKLQSIGLPWRLHMPVAMGLAACLPVGLFLALYQPFTGQVHGLVRYNAPAEKVVRSNEGFYIKTPYGNAAPTGQNMIAIERLRKSGW